ncbi:MAG TPA: hypothetical protein VHM67_07325, partial [Gemmatimonadaceae bacterium]|nr:hypothetical protein [Gemmatimonadaceae bacterium]
MTAPAEALAPDARGSHDVAVLAPTGRDASLIVRALASEGVDAGSCERVDDLLPLLHGERAVD